MLLATSVSMRPPAPAPAVGPPESDAERMCGARFVCVAPAAMTVGLEVRHCLCLVISPPPWLRHVLYLVFPLPVVRTVPLPCVFHCLRD